MLHPGGLPIRLWSFPVLARQELTGLQCITVLELASDAPWSPRAMVQQNESPDYEQ